MWIYSGVSSQQLILDFSLLLLVILGVIGRSEGCGHYEKLAAGGSGYIATDPGYKAYEHCIWWIETEPGYRINMTVTYVGDYNNGRCGDYIIIRDGNGDPDEILNTQSTNCTALTNHIVEAYASWIRVEFVSDGITATSGFQGHFSSYFVGASLFNITTPIKNCKSYEWSCSNKECLSLSYRCDGFNDCGCTKDCDEHNCQGLGLTLKDHFLIGSFGALGVFIGFFIFAFVFEMRLRQRTLLEDPKAQAELQKQAERKRKAAYQKQVAKDKQGAR